jgi:hypothetical protein
MRKPLPPLTKRYCTNCQQITKYKYDRVIGHSYCLKCGRSSLFSRREPPKKFRNQVVGGTSH